MKIERILLIDPPSARFIGKSQPYTPLGLAYIAAVLAANNYEVKIFNADLEHRSHVVASGKSFAEEVSNYDLYIRSITNPEHPLYHEVVSVVEEYMPDVIGMTVRTGNFFIAKTIVDLIKNKFPAVQVVIGGNHVTFDPEQSLMRIKADYAVRGEGEHIFYNLIKTIEKNKYEIESTPGISYREDDKIVHNPPAQLIQNIDEIPFPNRDTIIHHNVMAPEQFGSIFASRGCPFACGFCDSRTTWTRKVRRRSPENIVDEMIYLKEKYKTSFFTFNDDCFVTKKEQTFALCDEIDKRGLSDLPKKDFRWWCEIHPSLITEDLVERMKRSGCVVIAIGLESGSQRILNNINKRSSVDIIKKAAKAIKLHDVDFSTFAMIGFPWETEDDIKATINLIGEMEPDSAAMSVFTPLPGTEIYNYCEKNNLIDYGDDFLNLFYFRNSSFYNPSITEEKSKELIAYSFNTVDAMIEENRRRKIMKYLESKALQQVEERLGLKLALNQNNSTDIMVSCDQRYTESTIRIVLSKISDRIDNIDLADLKNDLTSELLGEFPQYAKVQINECREDKNESNFNRTPDCQTKR